MDNNLYDFFPHLFQIKLYLLIANLYSHIQTLYIYIYIYYKLGKILIHAYVGFN